MEKALALVVRTTDWSETSRIATLFTRELGKVRALAKGGRRLKSNFENALDLLNVCSIVLLRKSSGSLNLLTEAQVQESFPELRKDLQALYSGYYLAELLGDWTEEFDPHPHLFDETLAALRTLGQPGVPTGPRLAHIELVLLRELGYGPVLETCAVCSGGLEEERLTFSSAAGGVLCPACQQGQRDKRPFSLAGWLTMRLLNQEGETWRKPIETEHRKEIRQILNGYVTYLLGRRPRLQAFLES